MAAAMLSSIAIVFPSPATVAFGLHTQPVHCHKRTFDLFPNLPSHIGAKRSSSMMDDDHDDVDNIPLPKRQRSVVSSIIGNPERMSSILHRVKQELLRRKDALRALKCLEENASYRPIWFFVSIVASLGHAMWETKTCITNAMPEFPAQDTPNKGLPMDQLTANRIDQMISRSSKARQKALEITTIQASQQSNALAYTHTQSPPQAASNIVSPGPLPGTRTPETPTPKLRKEATDAATAATQTPKKSKRKGKGKNNQTPTNTQPQQALTQTAGTPASTNVFRETPSAPPASQPPAWPQQASIQTASTSASMNMSRAGPPAPAPNNSANAAPQNPKANKKKDKGKKNQKNPTNTQPQQASAQTATPAPTSASKDRPPAPAPSSSRAQQEPAQQKPAQKKSAQEKLAQQKDI